MGALTPHGIQQRADKAIAALYGTEVESGKIDFTAAADAQASGLTPGFYIISNPDGECFIKVNGAATTDGTSQYVAAGSQIANWFGVPGVTPFDLHVRGRTLDGTLFYSRMDDTEP
jgi:hypothetical protein